MTEKIDNRERHRLHVFEKAYLINHAGNMQLDEALLDKPTYCRTSLNKVSTPKDFRETRTRLLRDLERKSAQRLKFRNALGYQQKHYRAQIEALTRILQAARDTGRPLDVLYKDTTKGSMGRKFQKHYRRAKGYIEDYGNTIRTFRDWEAEGASRPCALDKQNSAKPK